ncbi:response regulator [Arenibaculum sp.]|uniref:response regulator n=1 Tax=Arenibaculum sp. TaxID=2865862 RepID=UPI002E153338
MEQSAQGAVDAAYPIRTIIHPMHRAARILIAEDEPIVALDLGETVIALGHVLEGYATSAADAFSQVEARRPDLVLMDIRLGLSDGVAAARRIRTRFGLPVVFVSAFATDLDRRGLADLGPVVPKPFVPETLERAIRQALDDGAAA